MPLLRRRPLTRAAMVGGAGYAIGKRHQAGAQPEPAQPAPTQGATAEPVDDAASEANRIDALTKLKSLFDDGVLTQEQYDSEHARLTAGI
jgi:Short C-terminal domain